MPNTGKYKLEIEIVDNNSGEQSSSSMQSNIAGGGGGEGASSLKKLTKTVSTAYAFTAIPKQIFSYHMSRVGLEQGNSLKQQKIDAGMSLANMALTTVAGFVAGGPIAGGLMLISNMIGMAQQYDSYSFNKKWEDIALQELRTRAGPSMHFRR